MIIIRRIVFKSYYFVEQFLKVGFIEPRAFIVVLWADVRVRAGGILTSYYLPT